MNKTTYLLIFFIFCLTSVAFARYQAPQSREDKQNEEMGSLLGDEGIVFRTERLKNESTKFQIAHRVNRYIFESVLEILHNIPITSIDYASGSILTDWYMPTEESKSIIKMDIIIDGDVISPESLTVRVFERNINNNLASFYINPPNNDTAAIAQNMAEKILRHSRDLYLKQSR
ncbi:MAG: DUF3576 domain-containing protein [Rickettsiaceae bacterium]